jgi:EAL domain-containing protein (putative c-di-GMP-specific phosphodiesterase class I)
MDASPLGKRLLVIDDEPALGRLVKSTAEAVGFEVTVTRNPTVFTDTARSWRPTILMLDLGMPGTDGIQLLRGLAEDKCAGLVILMSGADVKVLEAAMQLGRDRGLLMSGILEKPLRPEALRKFLARFQAAKTLLSEDLADAIAAHQLFLEYQPKLDCRLGRVTGVEALVRWSHPTLGVLAPDRFVPLAEETDLIHRLTDWVVLTAAKQVAAWHMDNPTLEVAVNIAAKNIEDLGLPDRLHKLCRTAGAECTSITLELTETGATREAVQMMDVLTRLRLKGFRLSIDDFGTGFSSLAQLQKLPFSEVKIDRSFVTQMMENDGCKAIVEIVIDLARKLKLRSVAEGVEDEAALHALTRLGCDVAQGYYVARPVVADRIPAFIHEYQLMRGVFKAPTAPFPSPFTNARAWRRRKIAVRHPPISLASLVPEEVTA